MQVYKKDAHRGLFRGMQAKLLLNILTRAFTFLTYEEILASVHAAHLNLAAWQKGWAVRGPTQ